MNISTDGRIILKRIFKESKRESKDYINLAQGREKLRVRVNTELELHFP
jgi:hypothetical protein